MQEVDWYQLDIVGPTSTQSHFRRLSAGGELDSLPGKEAEKIWQTQMYNENLLGNVWLCLPSGKSFKQVPREARDIESE